MRKFDAHLDFDLALAKTQTPDNPVFYIQYAHARVESVKRNFDEKGLKIDWKDVACLAKLDSPLEVQTLRLLSQFEENVLGAEKTLEPFRLVPYLRELAAAFHRFYAESRVVTEDEELSRARMMMAISVQSVLRQGLGLLGVSAPEKM
jgi:arginyl-tRNA synthetase